MSEPPLSDRLAAVRERVSNAARSAGRDPESITTIVVTKFHPASLVRELSELGVRDVGENRNQEAVVKAAELADLDLTWHFVGQLQSKKARQVASYARVIHSVDRPALVQALAHVPPGIDCFVQLNLTDDPGRGGADPRSFEPLVEEILRAPGLRLLGVMAIAPLDEDPRRAFSRLRESSERLLRIAPDAAAISAGMSEDYPAAIAEGATHLRIGTAITGIRQQHG